MFVNAGVIFGRAIAGHKRCKESGKGDRDFGAIDALEAIVFSVAAMESFVNEAAKLASQPIPPNFGETPEAIAQFSRRLLEAERNRYSLGEKFQCAREVIAGAPYDKSMQPYQDFALLVGLRNAIVHYKVLETIDVGEDGIIEFNQAKILQKIDYKNISALILNEGVEPGQITVDWINKVCTVAVAWWSCCTASAMVFSVLDILPPCYFQGCMEKLYRGMFSVSTAN